MNVSKWLPLCLSLILGLAAAFVARQILSHRTAPAAHAHGVTVVATKTGISPGQTLTADDLTVIEIAARQRPAGAFASPSEVTGRVAVATLVAGQTVLEPLLAPRGATAGLQALVPRGLRAITLDTTDSSGLSGLLTPGAHVDVVATAVDPNNPDRSVSRTIVQDVAVVAVGQRLGSAEPDKKDGTAPAPAPARTVTLLVNPHDAEALDVAGNLTKFRLVLRGHGDQGDVGDQGVMLAELRRGEEEVPPTQPAAQSEPAPTTRPADPFADAAPHEAPRRTVRVILGNDEQELVFREATNASQMANTDRAPAIPQ